VQINYFGALVLLPGWGPPAAGLSAAFISVWDSFPSRSRSSSLNRLLRAPELFASSREMNPSLLLSSALNELEAASAVVDGGVPGEVEALGAAGDAGGVSAALAANGNAKAPANAMMLMNLLSMMIFLPPFDWSRSVERFRASAINVPEINAQQIHVPPQTTAGAFRIFVCLASSVADTGWREIG
jgi:hypothetical protein